MYRPWFAVTAAAAGADVLATDGPFADVAPDFVFPEALGLLVRDAFGVDAFGAMPSRRTKPDEQASSVAAFCPAARLVLVLSDK